MPTSTMAISKTITKATAAATIISLSTSGIDKSANFAINSNNNNNNTSKYKSESECSKIFGNDKHNVEITLVKAPPKTTITPPDVAKNVANALPVAIGVATSVIVKPTNIFKQAISNNTHVAKSSVIQATNYASSSVSNIDVASGAQCISNTNNDTAISLIAMPDATHTQQPMQQQQARLVLLQC